MPEWEPSYDPIGAAEREQQGAVRPLPVTERTFSGTRVLAERAITRRAMREALKMQEPTVLITESGDIKDARVD